MNIYGVHSVEDFEVIEIVDDIKPYPTLMGLEWAFENQEIINLKRMEMTFEVGDFKFIAPLDPTQGKRYIDPARANDIENFYNMIAWMDDYVNPTADFMMSWRSISSCALDLEEFLEHWQ
jgi:hypothetical protein